MKKYVAPNRDVVTFKDDGGITVRCPGGGPLSEVSYHHLHAVRDALQAERDEELGRLRDAVDSNLVVYRTGSGTDELEVMDECAGSKYWFQVQDLREDRVPSSGIYRDYAMAAMRAAKTLGLLPRKCAGWAKGLLNAELETAIMCEREGGHSGDHGATIEQVTVTWPREEGKD